MTPSDPRHGQTAGYHQGCRNPCCQRAILRYEKRRRMGRIHGERRAIPALGAQRRIQALMCLGWSSVDIAAEAGWLGRNQVLRILNGQKGKPSAWVERATHETVCAVFERLSMRLPTPSPYTARTQAHAARKGYAPPLAWDDIDDENEQPSGLEQFATIDMTATRAHELEHFAFMGDTLETVCVRLDVDKDALWKWCDRHGHLDLWERLAVQTRATENQHTVRGAA